MNVQELHLANYSCVSRFKSVRRAMRRGLINDFGFIAPKRPFNSRKRTRGRKLQAVKEKYYVYITGKNI